MNLYLNIVFAFLCFNLRSMLFYLYILVYLWFLIFRFKNHCFAVFENHRSESVRFFLVVLFSNFVRERSPKFSLSFLFVEIFEIPALSETDFRTFSKLSAPFIVLLLIQYFRE